MRKISHIIRALTTIDVRNAVCAHERVVSSPNVLFSGIRHYG